MMLLRGGVKPGHDIEAREGQPGMFSVEVYAAVRRFVFMEGNSRREAAFSVPPGYVRSKLP